MQDFAAELRQARSGRTDSRPMMADGGGTFGAYLVQSAMRNGFDLGFEAGHRERSESVPAQLEAARAGGFDEATRTLLSLTLEGLAEVVAQLDSRRAHKVMNERAREKLNELVVQLGAAATILPAVHPEQMGLANIVEGFGG